MWLARIWVNGQFGGGPATGDLVTYAGDRARVEFAARLEDPETRWYFEQFGGGAMILAPAFGRVFLPRTEDEEDLIFIAHASPPPA
jgi:hypothetical protein